MTVNGHMGGRHAGAVLGLLLCIGVGSACAQAGAQASAQAGASDVEIGRKLYMSNGCYACHGTVGQGGERSAGPRIAPEPYPFEAFKAMIRTPREAMPRYDARFVSDEQLLSIHRFLGSIAKGPAAKDIPQLRSAAVQ